MSQAPAYTRGPSLTTYASEHPDATYNPSLHESEFNNIKQTTDALRTNAALIQRDDGKLRNGSVHPEALASETRALLITDWNPRGPWVTATKYAVKDVVEVDGIAYISTVEHVSGVSFATDLAAGKWLALAMDMAALAESDGASRVGFQQSGTGATARDLQDKGREQRTAEDFGAAGDGATDDAAEFSLLVAASTAGEVVRGVKGKVYRINSVVTVDKSMVFRDFKFKIGGNHTMFSLTGDGIGFEGCEFDLSLGNNSSSKAISAVDRSRIWVRGCRFTDGQDGIYFDNCSYVWIEDNYCDNSGNWHIQVYGGSYITIKGNVCLNGTLDGIKVSGEATSTGVTRTISNISVIGNICFLNGRDGIDFATNECNNVIISDNICINNKLQAIEVKTLAHADTSLDYSMRNVLIANNVCGNGAYTDNNQTMISCQSGVGDFAATTAGKQLFRDVRITGNKIHIVANSTNAYFAIRCVEVVKSLIDGNHVTTAAGTGGAIGLIRAHYGTSTVIRANVVDAAGVSSAVGISVSSLGTANATTGVVITKNRVSTGANANCIRVNDAAVASAEVYDNEVFPDTGQYAFNDSGTGTRYSNQYRGVTSGNPNVRGYPGDYFLEANQGDGYPERWTAVTQGNPATWRGMNQRGFRTNAGSPSGSVSPIFPGEELFDSSGSVWYKAHGTGNTNWTQLSN